jgi:hypothetical protein
MHRQILDSIVSASGFLDSRPGFASGFAGQALRGNDVQKWCFGVCYNGVVESAPAVA